MTMESHVNEFAPLNVQKRKSNVAENPQPLDAYKTTSVLTKATQLIPVLLLPSFVTEFVK